ncbi:MAG TPA: MerR family transcriptional regulator [Nocardioidaceae bacterium]|nr:MerR family transcriptional regulator [Nocardioidaceae bacterium]
MFTIKQAAQRTGVPEASLRAWERRYGVVTPRRTESGYRMYDEQALATVSEMKRLVEDGWSPAAAAAKITGDASLEKGHQVVATTAREPRPAGLAHPEAAELTEAFLEAAAVVDPARVESALDRAYALGSFETVTDGWLMPTLRALGDAWAAGWVDVAGEHAAAHAVMRRLSHSFSAAASVARGPRVVVALPQGSLHELGALAFATAARRRGLAVVYLGADLPVGSWVRAVHAFPTRAAVIAVPTEEDREVAARTAAALQDGRPDIVVAAGGRYCEDLGPGVVALPQSITEAVASIDVLAS